MTTTGKLFFTALALVIIGGGFYYLNKTPVQTQVPVMSEMFIMNGQPITLVNGKYEKEIAPGSASKTTVLYFGNEVTGDFNADGKEDKAYLVTENSGGTGTLFYLVTSLGGEAAAIGDRIAPQSTQYVDGKIVVNYADRKQGEPMTTAPSVGVSRYFKFENGNLVETKTATPATATSTSSGKVSADSPEGKCVNAGGQWSSEYKECTGTDSNTCTAIGGTFNSCASVCRHDPKAEVCAALCVAVCTL